MALTAGEINILIKARDDASRHMGHIGNAAGRMGQTIRRASMVGVAGLAALGVATFRFAGDFDDAANTLRRGTGATGEALEGLKEDFRETFRGVPDSMADVATATADLNTRLGLTGPPLQAMTRQFLDLARVAEVDVATAVAAGTRAFGDWSIATENQTEALDHVWRVAQTTGIGVDSLMQKVVQFGAPLRQFGYGFEEATVLLGAWEREGVNTEAILGALKIGVANFARENIDAVTGLEDFIAELTELGPGAEATARAIEIFGSRAGPDMAAAVTEGRFALDDLMAVIEASPETIAAAAEETLTWQDKLGRLRNEILVRVEPALARMTEKAEEFSEWLAEEGAPKAEEFIRSLRPLLPVLEGTWESFRLGIETIRPPIEWLFNFIIDNKPVLVAAIAAIGLAIVIAFGPVSIAIAAILGLILAIGWVRDNWEMLRDETERILGLIGDVVDDKMGYIDEVIVWYVTHYVTVWRKTLTAIVGFVRENWETIKGIFGDSLRIISTGLIANLQEMANIFQFAIAIIRGDWRTAWDELVDIAQNRWNLIREISELSFSLLRGMFTFHLELWKTLVAAAWDVLVPLVQAGMEGMKNAVSAGLDAIIGWYAALPGRILDALGDLRSLLIEAGKDIMQGLWDGMKDVWNSVKDWVASLGGKIRDLKGPDDPTLLLESGRQIMGGLLTGLEEGFHDVEHFVREAGAAIVDAMADAMRGLQGMMRDLLMQPSIESAQEAIELAKLRLAEFQIGPAAEEARRTREAAVAEMERALGEFRLAGVGPAVAAAEEQLRTLQATLRWAREHAPRLLPDLAGQIAEQEAIIREAEQAFQAELERRQEEIDLLRESRSAAEEQLDAIREQIDRLRELAQQRRLERDLLAAQAIAANELLLSEEELRQAMLDQITAIADLSAALIDMAKDGWSALDALRALQLGLDNLAQTILEFVAGLGRALVAPAAVPMLVQSAGPILAPSAATGLVPQILETREPVIVHQYITIQSDSPAEIAHKMEMAGLELGQRLAMEGV